MITNSHGSVWEIDEIRMSRGRTLKFQMVLDEENRSIGLDIRLFTAKNHPTQSGVRVPIKEISKFLAAVRKAERKLKRLDKI